MTNKEKIKLVQENKSQLLESCEQCLNCSGWVPELTDWDVMQSGYGEKQLYPQVLEVLEMHDVPCTTRVYENRIEPDFPQAILEAEKKRQPDYMGSINE